MPQPTTGDVHVNTPLTQISIAFIQDDDEFIADEFFPEVPVAKQSDRYFIYEKDAWFRSDAQERAPSTESAGSGWTLDNTPTYFASKKALHKDVDDDTRANADPVIDMDRDATEYVTRQLLLRKEKDWAAAYFTTSLWDTDFTPGTLWDAGGSTPIQDIRSQMLVIKRTTGLRANKFGMGEEVWNILQDHPDFLDRIKFTQTGIVTTGLLAVLLGLQAVMVMGAVENTATEGQTASLSFIFGKSALLVHAAPRPSLLTASAGYTFRWTGLFGGGEMGTRIKRFRMEAIASDRVEGESAYDQKLVASELGVFFNAVVS
ncbi:hypothetical protein LCGC14_1337380 [marine sediment metagenome]|uniref:Uncharacterized protein n=1 Tax=marine sediment metagenome TaxID=412755 RepID=A0A0F9KFF6_9ZZZZ